MGTNYYAIPKVTAELKKEIIKAVTNENFNYAKKLMPIKIHIGKSSAGWAFLFNHNDWEYFDNTKDSVRSFLQSCEILDEYERPLTFSEFWEVVKAKKHYPNDEYASIISGLVFSDSTNFC